MPDQESSLELTISGALTTSSTAGPEAAPFDADIADVILSVGTAPTGADLDVDIKKNGTSLFGTALGTVRGSITENESGTTESGLGVSDTSVVIELTSDQPLDIKAGQVLLIGTEKLLVGPAPTTNTGLPSNTPSQASYDTPASGYADPNPGPNGFPLYKLPVTRGYDGTTAAAAAAGTSVFPAKPFIAAGSTESSLAENGALAVVTPEVAQGDEITVSVTQIGSTVAGSNLTVSLELDQR